MISTFFNVKSVYEDDVDVLLFWQTKIFNSLFSALVIIGCVPYIITCKSAVETSGWGRLGFYTLVYLLICGVAFFKKMPFKARVWAGISGFYALGVFSLLAAGLTGNARLYFLCFSAFSAIFSGIKGGVFTVVLNILTLSVCGLFFLNDAGLSVQYQWAPNAEQWRSAIGIFSFVCAAITFPLAVLIKALEIFGREFKHLIKNSTDLIWTLDQNFNISFINSAVYPLFGFFQTEVLGKSITRFLHDKTIDAFKTRLQDKDGFNYETVIHHKNGTPVPVEVTVSKISDFPDSQNMYQGLIRDVSQKKLQEEEQQRLKQKLVQAEKLKALGILAGSVAHDLNNILSGIATYPEVLMMDADIDPQVRQGLIMIRDSGQKASAVVSDLLTISRGAGAEMEIININAVLDRYTAAHDFDKIKKSYDQVQIEIQTEPELFNITGSYIHIEKTIMNLVLNAVEEVSKKIGGKVLISTANSYIDPSIPGYEGIIPGEYVILSVVDNGSGIDSNNLKKIFEPFFTKKEMGKSGTGLGLTVVWNAVQDHNGFINVISNDKGTTFDLLFPAIRQEIQQKETTGSLDEIKGQGQMILIVDDLKNQQKIAVTILENLGYRAKAVDNGFLAVDFIRNNPTDLVILDMIMAPSISGLETYRMIKKINPGQKAIIASGYSESEEVLLAQDLGAGSFVKKPYTVLDMGIAVKEELEK